MFDLGRILVIIEAGQESQPALEKAKSLARYAEAELELFICDYSTYLEDGYYFDPIRAQELRREHGEKHLATLEKLAGPLRDNGLDVSCATAWGNPPYEEILKRVRELKPDLVVKATQHRERLARLILSNDDWELIRYCPAPLMLVKDQAWTSPPVFLAAVDPGHSHDKPASLDNEILQLAISLATDSGGIVHLYHSTHLPPLAGMYPVHSDFEVDLQKISKLADQYGLSSKHCHLSEKDIVKTLPELANTLGVNAVVMGAVSRSRLDRMLIGNTAEKVLDALHCDVIVVKPGKAAPLQKVLL